MAAPFVFLVRPSKLLSDTLQPGAYLSNIGFPRPIQPAHRFQNASGPLFDIGAQCLDSIVEG
jgi:hypothetical protein